MKRKLLSKPTYINKLYRGGLIPKFENSGKLPIGTKSQYDHVVELYQSFVDKGIDPQVALDLVNLKVAEKGWTGYATGDNKKYPDVDSFTDHVIDWHQRMYPDSIKAKNFNQFYNGIMVTPKYKYNPRGLEYRKELEKTRPGVVKRINYHRQQLGQSPLAHVNTDQQPMYAKNGGSIQKMQLGNIIKKAWSFIANGHDGTFNEAFKTARDNNEEYFRWNNKLYNTKIKVELKPKTDYNSLRYKYIEALENPRKIGFDEKTQKWTPPKGKGYDSNLIGIGLDIRTNDKVKNFLETNGRTNNPWLTHKEMINLLNETLSNLEKILDSRTKGIKLSDTKRAIAIGLMYHGLGPKIWNPNGPKTTKVRNALFNGSDQDLITAVSELYNGMYTERSRSHDKFWKTV